MNQEVVRKKVAKDKEKNQIAGVGDARLRYTHPFPNAPVTVRAADQPDGGRTDETNGGKAESSSAARQSQPAELGRIGEEREARSRAGSGLADGPAERLSGARRDGGGRDETGGFARARGGLTAILSPRSLLDGRCKIGAWRAGEKQLS